MRVCVSLLLLIAAASASAPVEAQEISLFPVQSAKTDTGLDVGSFAISLADRSRVYGVAGDRLVVSRDGGVAWPGVVSGHDTNRFSMKTLWGCSEYDPKGPRMVKPCRR